MRFTRVNGQPRPYVQHCVKGHAGKTNAVGASYRHEDEILNNRTILLASYFNDQTTLDIIKGNQINNIGLHFGTDVSRFFLGYQVVINGKRAIYEIAFDDIKYEAPEVIGSTRKNIEFFMQNEIEIEYMHPVNDNGDLSRTAKLMGLNPFTASEIDQGMEIAAESVQELAKKLNIEMTPEKASKGERGFFELKSQGAGIFIPQDSKDAKIYLPEISSPL
jgi:hypothetical protein